jgi:non-lysosomal glucosylceramidase
MTGLGDLVPREMQRSALSKIYDNNVMKFAKGEMGAVNGIAADGTIIRTNEQVQEVWIGTTFSVAALMLGDQMKDQAYHTAGACFTSCTKPRDIGSARLRLTMKPETIVASMYMRPAAIWAMEMTRPPQ